MMECLPTDQCRHSRDRDIHRVMEGLLRRRVQAQVHRWVGVLGLDLDTHGNSTVTVILSSSHHLIPGDQADPLHPDHLDHLIKEGALCHQTDMEGIVVRSLHPLLLVSHVEDRGITRKI